MTADRERARLFRLALASGYAEYCRKSAGPTRIERLAAWFDKNAFWTGVAWMGLLVPCLSSPWWNEAFRAALVPPIGWTLVALVCLTLTSATVSFVLRCWHLSRETE
jgi:formate-dependent nitrite reductase membrane component NrfD